MKVLELLEQDEWENHPPNHKTHIRSLRKKVDAIDHQIEIINDTKERLYTIHDALPNSEKYRKIFSPLDQKQKHLVVQREKIRAEIAKASINMKNVIHDPELAYRHAKSVRNGPFPEGEDAIAKNPRTAFDYAIHVLGKRFHKGEPAIATVPELRNNYRQTFGTINYEYPPKDYWNEDK